MGSPILSISVLFKKFAVSLCLLFQVQGIGTGGGGHAV